MIRDLQGIPRHSKAHGMSGGEAEVAAGRGIDLRSAFGHPDLGLDVFGPRQAEDVLQEVPPDEAPTHHVGHVPGETIIAAPKEQRQGQQVELLLSNLLSLSGVSCCFMFQHMFLAQFSNF